MNKFYAFTLAEVLVTLAIIGVVAAMSIPSLMQNTQNKEYVVALKKFYAVTNQALQKMSSDYGCTGDLSCTGIFASDDPEAIGNIFASYFNVAKNCGVSSTAKCFGSGTNWKFDGSGSNEDWDGGDYRFVNADGSGLLVIDVAGNCGSDFNYKGQALKLCADLYVDVNGAKPPNRYGRDAFAFVITKNAVIYPYPWKNESGTIVGCDVEVSTQGDTCADRIIEEGWEMTY